MGTSDCRLGSRETPRVGVSSGELHASPMGPIFPHCICIQSSLPDGKGLHQCKVTPFPNLFYGSLGPGIPESNTAKQKCLLSVHVRIHDEMA